MLISETKKYVEKKGKVKASELANFFSVSRQYASKLLNNLVRDGTLLKIGSTRGAFYVTERYAQLNTSVVPYGYTKRLANTDVEEHVVYEEIVRHFPHLQRLPENVKSIIEYAFSEMLNNAADHSKSDEIVVSVRLDNNTFSFIVDDFGIGVYRNVMQKRKLDSELEAIQDLLKGKVTTAPAMHSGEGIFFTSKVGDCFILDSYGYQLKVDNNIEDVFIRKVPGRQKEGTRVTFSINVGSEHHLNDVFKEYSNIGDESDFGFDKTEIYVRLYTTGGVNISRSQARRVLADLEKFSVIVMDYDRVPTVGQAFADEVYRVFKNKYPKIEIQNVNMNETVQFMVNRAITEARKK